MGVAAEKSWNPQLCGGVGLRVGLHSYSTVKSWNPHYYNGGGGGGGDPIIILTMQQLYVNSLGNYTTGYSQ